MYNEYMLKSEDENLRVNRAAIWNKFDDKKSEYSQELVYYSLRSMQHPNPSFPALAVYRILEYWKYKNYFCIAPDKRGYPQNIFLISAQKRML